MPPPHLLQVLASNHGNIKLLSSLPQEANYAKLIDTLMESQAAMIKLTTEFVDMVSPSPYHVIVLL